MLILLILGPHRIGDYYTETDFYGGYVEGARQIQHGRLDPGRYGVVGPVFDVMLALVGFVTRNLFAAGEIISLAGAVATLLLWFELLRRRVGATLGFWTIAFLAVNPTFLRYGYSATTDSLALCLEALAAYCILAARGRWTPLAAGIVTALAALTRYSAVALLPGGLVCYAALAPPPGSSRWRSLALYAAGFSLIAAPWLALAARAGHLPGDLLFHNIAFDIYGVGQGRTLADYQAQLQPGFHSLVDVLLRDPSAVLARESTNALTHLNGDVTRLLEVPVAIACATGVLLAAFEGSWRRLLPVWLLGLFLYLSLVPAFHSARYSLALAPFYLSLAGAAVASPRLARLARLRSIPLMALAALVPLGFSAVSSFATQRNALALLPTEVLPAAQVLRRIAPAGARVMALKPHIAYHSGLDFVPFPPTGDISALAEECRRRDVRFLYYSWIEANNRPSFWYLLDTASPVPGLEAEVFVAHNPTAIYRIGPGFGALPSWIREDTLRWRAEARFLGLTQAGLRWRARLSLAVWARDQGLSHDALVHARAVTRARPEMAMGWRLYGDANMELGRTDSAIVGYRRALAVQPGDIEARVLLGWALLRAGEPTSAADAWRPVIGATMNRAALEQMIPLFRSLGDDRSAAAALEALRALSQGR